MLGIPLRYLSKRPVTGTADLAVNTVKSAKPTRFEHQVLNSEGLAAELKCQQLTSITHDGRLSDGVE